MADILISDTRSISLDAESGGRGGFGIYTETVGGLTLERAVLAHNRSVALFVMGPSREPEPTTEDCDNGVDDNDNGWVDCEELGCRREENCLGDNTQTISNVIIRDTAPAACGEIPQGEPNSCIEDGYNAGGGIGLVVQEPIPLELSEFLIEGSTTVGFVVAKSATPVAHNGHIRNNAVGVHIMGLAFDITQLCDAVFIYDNDIDVARGTLVLPDPNALLGDGD